VLETYFNRKTERQKTYRVAPRRTRFTIFYNGNAMMLSWVGLKQDRGQKVVAWQDVVRIDAFKRDLYVVDLICLRILLDDNATVEIDEEMEGWDSLVDNLPEYLLGCERFGEWFDKVAYPPFKPKLTVIYRRNYCDSNRYEVLVSA
jgi:hypothetical protein